VPFKVIHELTGDVTYGGRITDDWDRRVMNCLLADYCNKNVSLSNTACDGTFFIFVKGHIVTEHSSRRTLAYLSLALGPFVLTRKHFLARSVSVSLWP
jgi:hypothetical protein